MVTRNTLSPIMISASSRRRWATERGEEVCRSIERTTEECFWPSMIFFGLIQRACATLSPSVSARILNPSKAFSAVGSGARSRET